MRVCLGDFPTPVERLSGFELPGVDVWIKRDDRASALYGGNKVRKLEPMLAEAERRGATELVTVGSVGSHHVLASAVFGAARGFKVTAILGPQPDGPWARNNLAMALGAGLHALAAPYARAPLELARALSHKGSFYLQAGGSSLDGARGFVDAAGELAAQVRRGELPAPDLVVVAHGSGGTAGGLAAGFALAGLSSVVHGVSIVGPVRVFEAWARWLGRRAAPSTGRFERRLVVDSRWLGRGYGHATEDALRACAEAESEGLLLEPTYTGKAFACLKERIASRTAKRILYWHTLSAPPAASIVERRVPFDAIPVELRRLLESDG